MPSGQFDGVTSFLLSVLFLVALGPLQFGYHLVRLRARPACTGPRRDHANLASAQAELNAPEDVLTCRKKELSTTRNPNDVASMLLPDCIPMSKAAFATVAAIFTAGGLCGALAAGPLCSQYGRKLAMQGTAAVFLLGSAIGTVAGSVPLLVLGRICTGLGAGASTVIVPLYISEVSPPGARGFFGALTQVSVNTGIVITQLLGYLLSYGTAWRWILGTGVLVSAVHGLGLLAVPESPAWLACHRGDVATARRVLQKIRGGDANLDAEVAAWGAGSGDAAAAAGSEEERALLAESDAEAAVLSPRNATTPKSARAPVGFFQVARDPFYRSAIVAVIGIMFAQQICGINSVILYSVSLFDGLLPISSALVTLLISILNLLITIFSAPLPDLLGRKVCLIMSIVGQGTSSLGLALSILFGAKILSAIFVALFVASFALGLGPVPFIMASELVGQEAVGATQSWALAASYLATFLVAQFFPIVNEALNHRLGGGGWAYFLFATFAVGFAVFVSVYVPETRGKKDADEVWGRTRRVD